MRTRRSYIAASTVFVALLSAGTVQAAPLAGGPGNAARANAEASAVQQAAYRRCWITNGVRHCRWFSEPYDDYGYYDYYDYGPSYGYGPGIGFFFGGGGGRGHGHGHGFHGGGGHGGGGHGGGGHGGHR
jgi:hypothetical protein